MWGNIITIFFLSGCPYISESVVYWLQRTKKSFQESQEYCTWRFDGLAEVYSENQQWYLSSIAGGNEAWIGVGKCLQNWCYTGSHRTVSYTNWAKGEPNNHNSFFKGDENCVLMLSSQQWNDENCPYQYYFVCQQLQCKSTTCNRRGTCIELSNGFSCTCDQGFYGNNCENVTSCPVITKPNRSTVKCEGSHGKDNFQSVCTFTCERGFILNGNNSSTCQASGSWTTYNTTCQGTVNLRKLILIIVPMGAVALLALSVMCWWKRRNCQEQSNSGNDLSMQQKMPADDCHSIYVLPTPFLNNETPQDEMYVNNLSTHQDIYANLE